jgi:hypothetical protein
MVYKAHIPPWGLIFVAVDATITATSIADLQGKVGKCRSGRKAEKHQAAKGERERARMGELTWLGEECAGSDHHQRSWRGSTSAGNCSGGVCGGQRATGSRACASNVPGRLWLARLEIF